MLASPHHGETQESHEEEVLQQPGELPKPAFNGLQVVPSLAMLLLAFAPIKSPWDELLSTLDGSIFRPPGNH